MVLLNNEPNTPSWIEQEQPESNVDEEAETCIGVRVVSVITHPCCCNSNLKTHPYQRASSDSLFLLNV